jgi:heme A synthase
MVIGLVIPYLIRNLSRREKLEVVALLTVLVVAGLVILGLTAIILYLPFGLGAFISGMGVYLKRGFYW